MSLAFHEIAETNHRILNPFTEEKLMLLGEICQLQPTTRQLDLCCGKGEMLCQWSRRWGISGVGVDISPVFLAAAHQRAEELGVSSRVRFVEADAGNYAAEASSFDLVSCIGATWIGGGLAGTLRLMLPALKQDGLLLVGEPYWNAPPPDEAYAALEVGREDFTSLNGTLDRIEAAGLELVEMVLADGNTWDRYVAAQWRTLDAWLRAHPDAPNAASIRETNVRGKRSYLQYERQYLGWGVFVLKPR